MINIMLRHNPSEHSLIALAAMFILLSIAAFTYLWLLAQGNTSQGVGDIVQYLQFDPNDSRSLFGF